MSLTAHPGLPEFDYIRPQSLIEASQFLASHWGEARPLMGGTDVFVRMRDGIWNDKYLVDVKSLDGMNEISYDPVEGLLIGAAVSMNRVIGSRMVGEKYPVLVQASNSCASYQLRTRATIAGNICNASPAGDTIGACILLGGMLNVHGVDGARQESLSNFFLGPGKTKLRAGDIVTSIGLQVPSKGMAGKYFKLGRNKISDLAIVGVTVVGWPDDDLPSGFRIRLALASVAPVPLVVERVEAMLAESEINEQVIAGAAQAAMLACDPIDDVRASARYRTLMVRNLSAKALTEVWQRLKR
jgi:carbon-monoxide dehydrogenase medium subunit